MPSSPAFVLLLLALSAAALPAWGQQATGAITGIADETFFGEQLAAGDLDGDGLPDLLVRSRAGSQYRLRLFPGASGFPTTDLRADESALVLAEYAADPASARDFVVGDFDGDGFDDVIVQSGLFCGGANVTIDGALGDAVSTSALAVGDLNGDGIDDLVVGGVLVPDASESVYFVFLGGARFAELCAGGAAPLTQLDAAMAVRVETQPGAARALATGDLNGDGYDDLLLADTSDRTSAFGAARGAVFAFFGGAVLPPSREVTADRNDADATFLGTGDDGGEWPDAARLTLRSSLAAGDLDGDGFDDLVVATRWASGYGVSVRREVLVFRGSAALAGAFTPEAASGRIAFSNELWLPPPGEEVLVAVADLDGDGAADLLGAAAPLDEYRASWARLGPLAFPFDLTDPTDFDFFSSGTEMFAVLTPPLALGTGAFAVGEPNAGIGADPFEPLGRVQTYAGSSAAVAAEAPAAPVALELLPAYPNPARAGEAVRLGLRLAQPAEVRLAVYDALGRRVAVLAAGPLGAGTHEVVWDGALAAGTYFYRFEAGSHAETRRLTLVR